MKPSRMDTLAFRSYSFSVVSCHASYFVVGVSALYLYSITIRVISVSVSFFILLIFCNLTSLWDFPDPGASNFWFRCWCCWAFFVSLTFLVLFSVLVLYRFSFCFFTRCITSGLRYRLLLRFLTRVIILFFYSAWFGIVVVSGFVISQRFIVLGFVGCFSSTCL